MFFVAKGVPKFLFFSTPPISTIYATTPNALTAKWKGEKANKHISF